MEAEPRNRPTSTVVQLQVVTHPGDSNTGVHVRIYALCLDGTIWVKYDGEYANVPNDGKWYPVL